MKTSTLFITLLFGFLTLPMLAQETIWMDADKKNVAKENAVYYRPEPKKVDEGFWLVDYFMDGTKHMEGLSTAYKLGSEQFEGLVLYYYKNGQVFKETHYEEGQKQGMQKVYYASGEVKEIGAFEEGAKDGVWKTFYKNGKIETKGKYRNGEKVGVWKTFYKNVYK